MTQAWEIFWRKGGDPHLKYDPFRFIRSIIREALEPITESLQRMEKTMADINKALADIDAATTALGTRVNNLVLAVANGTNLTDAQQKETDIIVSSLTGMASNPSTPVPVIPSPAANLNKP